MKKRELMLNDYVWLHFIDQKEKRKKREKREKKTKTIILNQEIYLIFYWFHLFTLFYKEKKLGYKIK